MPPSLRTSTIVHHFAFERSGTSKDAADAVARLSLLLDLSKGLFEQRQSVQCCLLMSTLLWGNNRVHDGHDLTQEDPAVAAAAVQGAKSIVLMEIEVKMPKECLSEFESVQVSLGINRQYLMVLCEGNYLSLGKSSRCFCLWMRHW